MNSTIVLVIKQLQIDISYLVKVKKCVLMFYIPDMVRKRGLLLLRQFPVTVRVDCRRSHVQGLWRKSGWWLVPYNDGVFVKSIGKYLKNCSFFRNIRACKLKNNI